MLLSWNEESKVRSRRREPYHNLGTRWRYFSGLVETVAVQVVRSGHRSQNLLMDRMWDKRKWGVKDDTEVFGLNQYQNDAITNQDRENCTGVSFWGKVRAQFLIYQYLPGGSSAVWEGVRARASAKGSKLWMSESVHPSENICWALTVFQAVL